MELVVKINDSPGDISYKDGDIVETFSNERILGVHAHEVCSVSRFPLDSITGLRPNDGLLMKFMEKTHAYKFERLNSRELKRTNLDTEAEEVLSDIANAKGEYIHIHDFLTQHLRNPRHKIFGSAGAEIWYGLPKTGDIDAIWNDIETHSDNIKDDHYSWPFSEIEKKHFLPINCRGFKDEVYTELSGPTVESRALPVRTEGVIVEKRQWQVPYWDLASALSVSVDDIRNPSKEVDARTDRNSRPKIDEVNVDKVEAGIITL